MKTIKIFCICFLLLSFLSCDYWASYCFVIKNNTNNEMIIKTSTEMYDNRFYLPDSIYTIKQGAEITFFQDLGICSKHYIPTDDFLQEDTIPKVSQFDIYVNGELRNTLRLRSNWEYKSKEQTGIYILRVNE